MSAPRRSWPDPQRTAEGRGKSQMLNRQIVPMIGAIVAAAWLAGARPALAVDTATRLEVATRLTAEAESYIERDDYTRAEPLLQAALIVAETAVGPTDARIIRNLSMLAELY